MLRSLLLMGGLCVLALCSGYGQEWRPTPCPSVEWADSLRVLFPVKEGIGYGISEDRTTFSIGDAISLDVWVDNETDRPYAFMTCEALFEWNVHVFDALGNRVLTRREKMERKGRPSVNACAGNVMMNVPARSCLTVPRLIPLNALYDLTPGTYRIIEQRGGAVKSIPKNAQFLVFSILK